MKAVYLMNGLQMGGGETIAVELLHRLKAHGVDVTLVTVNTRRDDPGLVAKFEKTGVRRIDLGARKLLDPGAFRRLLRILKEENFDLIHAPDQDTIIYGALARLFVRTPAVMARHVLDEPTPNWRQWVRARLTILAMRYGFDRNIAVSDALGRHISQRYGVRRDLMETVYNGLDLAQFDTVAKRSEMRADLGWGADDLVITMVGVLRAGKGHDVLLQSAPTILAADPRIRIKIVGGGQLEAPLKAQAAPFGDRVEFLGQRSDVPDILGASDLLVLPSHSEALPTVLMEAGAVGLPVVATDVGGTREIVVDGETGLIVPAGDADAFATSVTRLILDPALSAQFGEAARSRIHAVFSIDRQAENMADLYRRVVEAA